MQDLVSDSDSEEVQDLVSDSDSDSDDALSASVFSKESRVRRLRSSSSSAPVWNFQCVREQENAERERKRRMGSIPAFDADLQTLADTYGKMAAEGKAFLASLSDDSDDAYLFEKK